MPPRSSLSSEALSINKSFRPAPKVILSKSSSSSSATSRTFPTTSFDSNSTTRCFHSGEIASLNLSCEWPFYTQYAYCKGRPKWKQKTKTTTTSKIMSLHHNRHHHSQQQQHQQQQQQQPNPPPSTTCAGTQSSSSGIQRSSSSSPHNRYSGTFQQHQHRHLHHHYLPPAPRPPSTTSSGSLSTGGGFPDDHDLQDDLPIPMPPSEFSFQPHHQHPQTLQFHRHTSPYYTSPSQSQSQIHHHHHHHFVPHQSHPQIQPVTPGTAHSSRTASRQTYQGDEGDDLELGTGGGGEEENLLLVDNSVGVQDAVCLDPVTTDNFLTNIVQRFKREFIYTYVGEGTLLVSVNPYKPLSIFSPRVKAAYRNICNPFHLPPHIYGQLCLILQRNTSSLERTQTLLLTGESGSGKTTNLSYLLDFLATKQEPIQQPRSRRNSGRSTSGGSTRGGSYYLSTGSLHRHQQAHSSSCPHSSASNYYASYYDYGGGGGGRGHSSSYAGSGRASSLSLTAPPSQSGGGGVSSNQANTSNMARLILQGNFLLNAFGNCKTSKNCDASRFGKLLQLQVNFLGNVSGGRILTYQLEKWRIQGPITSSGGGGATTPESPLSLYERNFHIFYILLVGADSSTLKSLKLCRNLETYAMLNVKNHSSFLNASIQNPSTPFSPPDHYYSGKMGRNTTTYEGSFQLVKSTLLTILAKSSSHSSSSSSSHSAGSNVITPDHVFRMLAAILKLNNLVFAPVANIDGTEGCDVTNEQDLHDLGELLMIKPSATYGVPPVPSLSSPVTTPNNAIGNNNHNNHQHPLKTILTTRKVTRSDGLTTANLELTASESSSLRNSLTVSLYTRLFSWLTKQVQFASQSQDGGSKPSTSKHNLLNIVDFYGFEVFQTNGLEQFIINFTNEKIQYVLADLRLRMLQEEMVKDGLEWITIDTAQTPPGTISSASNVGGSSHSQNPGKLIDLVEENCHGLLSIFANCANDHELERQFSRKFTSSNKDDGGKDPSGSTPSKSTSNSLLVEYLQQCFRLRHWAGPVVYSTRHFALKNRDTLPPHLPHQLYVSSSDPLLRTLFHHDGRTPAPVDSGSRLLATSNMELSLRNLFQKCLNSSKNHRIYYIRCLKPNELSQPEVCEPALLKHQVKYHRLIDFLRVYRDGFCYNLGAFEFLERYKLLSLNTWPNWRLQQDPRLGIQVLMKDLQMKEGIDWCFGGGGGVSVGSGENLKVYLKGQRILSELEDFRRERMDDLALLIQKIWRGYRDWRKYEKMKEAHRIICTAWRKYLQCKRKEQRKKWKQMKYSVRLIQQRYILWKRSLFLRQLILQVRAELQQIGGVGTGVAHVMNTGVQGVPLGLPMAGSMLSPISRDWPYSPSYLEEASFQLRRVFHRWRCRLYRSRFNEIERAKMAEKVTASLLFKDKKSSYSRSVSHPFLGDYIRLRQNSQWRRTTMMMMLQSVQAGNIPPTNIPTSGSTLMQDVGEGDGGQTAESVKVPLLPSQQLQIVFADLINKITRSSGKFLPIVLVVTTTQIMILDPRTLNIKYKIPAAEVWRLSMSPYGDDICVLHLQQPMRSTGGSVVGPGEQGNLFGGANSDDDDAYYQYGDEPSPTVGNFGAGGCVCSSARDSGGGGTASVPGAYYAAGGGGGIEQPSPSPLQHQCQPGSGGCGLFGGGGDNDSGHYVTSEVVKLTKGDLILHTCHLIEMVTKIYLVVKNATGKGPEIVISNEFPAVFNNQRVQLTFRYSKQNPKGSRQEPSITLNPTPGTTGDISESSRAHLSVSGLVPDGPIQRDLSITSQNPVLPIPPPPPPTLSTLALPLREEPVIPPSQIKITRKKSTRMEFLIGHS